MTGRLNRALVATASVLALSGCMTMTPANYMVSQESRATLSKYAGRKLAVMQVTGPPRFDTMCRAVGDIQIVDGLTVAQFVAKGFNDEIKFAGLYSDNGTKLTSSLTKAAFSSSSNLVNGYWELGLTLQSSNGQSMSVDSRYDFEAGFVGPSACNNTSRALGPAVQKLVQKTVADPKFAGLLK